MRLPILALLLALATGCGGDPEPGPDLPSTDAEVETEARALLDTDRPWGAARLLRRYDAGGGELSPGLRMLAARAEAGVGDWERVRALLDGLDASRDPRALYLGARADDELGRTEAALRGYDAFLEAPPDPALALQRDAAALRRALVQARLGDDAGGAGVEIAPGWWAVLRAEALARDGATDRVEALAGQASGGEQTRRMWAARIDAAAQAGSPDAARALADRAYAATSGAARAQFALAAGRLAGADDAEARRRFRQAIEADPASPGARRATVRLRRGDPGPDDWLAVARSDRALGLNGDAADAFLRWLAAGTGDPGRRAAVRYDAADALFDAQRYDEVEAVLGPIQGRTDARELWAGTLSRMGRADEAAEVYLGLARTDPAPNLYFAADAHHQGGSVPQALALYRRVEQAHPGTRWAGLARLRRAGQAFLDGDYLDAARLWDGHRGDADALRARYWAGRAHAEAGDTEAAETRFRDVLRRDRTSYYALLASEALGEPFWPVPLAPSEPADPVAAEAAAAALRGADLLQEAGFPDAAEAAVDRAVRAAGSGRAARLALAEALVARGYGRRAIQIGQALGGPMTERRMRVLYPFPYRALVAAQAEAAGVDPFVAAALIRQESQFSTRATSPVGARGLMQLMPATGRALAAEVGIGDWDPDLLYLPEVNVVLGTRYVGQQAQAYDGALPAIFGAYNAGPHQVDAWRAFPEFGRDALFTERVPFRETRDYIKILTRNRAVYRGLYGTP